MQALGYRQVMEFLQGIRSLPETVELVKIRTPSIREKANDLVPSAGRAALDTGWSPGRVRNLWRR
jgi:hypothetical protein